MVNPGDWYAVGQVFVGPFYFDNPNSGEPCAQKYGVSVGIQVLAATDVATGFALHGRPVEKVPGPYRAEEIFRFVREVFEKHGKPRAGVVISKSVWQSSHEMLLDDDTSSRGEILRQLGVEIGPMDDAEKEKLTEALESLGFRVEWDGEKIP